MKIKVNDTIKVLIGDDLGKEAKVLKIFPSEGKLLAEGLNTYQRHLKKNQNQEGGIVTISRPLHISKVALVCPHCHKPTRVGYVGVGKDKTRVCRKCGKPIITVAKKK